MSYDPVTLKNLPRYKHELAAVEVRPMPGKPQPKPVDYRQLIAKYGRKS